MECSGWAKEGDGITSVPRTMLQTGRSLGAFRAGRAAGESRACAIKAFARYTRRVGYNRTEVK